jgi:glutamyl-tRNA reductase
MVLETCNRVEWYVETATPRWFSELLSAQMRMRWEANDSVGVLPQPQRLVEGEAAGHALRVVAGMESLAAGEAQISGQFQRALRQAMDEKTAGPVLKNLGGVAARVAKAAARVGYRSNARVGVHGLVATYLQRNLISPATVLVVGMGEIGRRTADLLEQTTDYRVIRMNRTVDPRHQSVWRPLAELNQTLDQVDGVVVSTSAARPVLRLDEVETDRPFFVLDIGVPAQTSGDRRNTRSAGIDDLVGLHVDQSKAVLETRVTEEIGREMARFRRYCMAREVVSLLHSIQSSRQQLLDNTLPERVRADLADLAPEERTRVETMVRSVIREYSNDIFDSIYGNLHGGAG